MARVCSSNEINEYKLGELKPEYNRLQLLGMTREQTERFHDRFKQEHSHYRLMRDRFSRIRKYGLTVLCASGAVSVTDIIPTGLHGSRETVAKLILSADFVHYSGYASVAGMVALTGGAALSLRHFMRHYDGMEREFLMSEPEYGPELPGSIVEAEEAFDYELAALQD